jgi:mono/diheme cytochrome c family protein
MKTLATALIVLVVIAAGGLIAMYSGAYNVGTNNHDNALVNWVLDTGMTRSVQHHARGLSAPSLADTAMIARGAREYRGCAGCHGAPGRHPGAIAKGLWPEAPDLAKSADDWTPEQLYWIIKNGIKFSSMPAWGPTRDEATLWALTAFVHKLPKLSAADYAAMTAPANADSGAGAQAPPR